MIDDVIILNSGYLLGFHCISYLALAEIWSCFHILRPIWSDLDIGYEARFEHILVVSLVSLSHKFKFFSNFNTVFL